MSLYTGEPFKVDIFRQNHGPHKLTPYIYNDESGCGIGLRLHGAPDTRGGLAFPRNLIAAWRGIEVLRLMHHIESADLELAILSCMRSIKANQRAKVARIVHSIGREVHESIMRSRVPRGIIEIILGNQSAGFAPDLYPITEEIAMNLLDWNDDFKDAEVLNPHELEVIRLT